MNKLPMTAAGHLLLEEELMYRIQVERPRLIRRIQDAIADDFNLAENSEYQAAKTEQEINEGRTAELEDKLARAEVIDVSKLSGDTIKFGATVTLTEEDTGEKKVWQIVGEPEADAHKGKVSVTSPIARALIGKTKEDTIEVDTPGGAKMYKVRRVEWLERKPTRTLLKADSSNVKYGPLPPFRLAAAIRSDSRAAKQKTSPAFGFTATRPSLRPLSDASHPSPRVPRRGICGESTCGSTG